MNEVLVPRFDERIFCVYENCIPEDKEFEHKTRKENVDSAIINRNEARLELGKDEKEGLDEFYISNMLMPIGGELSEKELEQISRNIAERVKEKLAKNK